MGHLFWCLKIILFLFSLQFGLNENRSDGWAVRERISEIGRIFTFFLVVLVLTSWLTVDFVGPEKETNNFISE